jgi:hypothetical protein
VILTANDDVGRFAVGPIDDSIDFISEIRIPLEKGFRTLEVTTDLFAVTGQFDRLRR